MLNTEAFRLNLFDAVDSDNYQESATVMAIRRIYDYSVI